MFDSQASRLTSRKVPPVRELPGLHDDVVQGLLSRPRSMPPKYFYDDRGSRLFDAICRTREYYPTRTEERLLQTYAQDIIDRARPVHVLEFGSGTARKTRHLLDAWQDNGAQAEYWPFDVCEEVLLESGQRLVREYDWLNVNVLVGDYCGGLDNLPRLQGPCLFLFLGGTIGNFTAGEAGDFLRQVRAVMHRDDYLLLGADRVKDSEVLHAAYNDSDGITAEFNLNLLHVLNRELDADFHPGGFAHSAVFNEAASQIEMYLVSSHEQSVYLGAMDKQLSLDKGERILTEISRKFTPQGLRALLAGSGFAIERHFQPDNGYFSLLLARPVG